MSSLITIRFDFDESLARDLGGDGAATWGSVAFGEETEHAYASVSIYQPLTGGDTINGSASASADYWGSYAVAAGEAINNPLGHALLPDDDGGHDRVGRAAEAAGELAGRVVRAILEGHSVKAPAGIAKWELQYARYTAAGSPDDEIDPEYFRQQASWLY